MKRIIVETKFNKNQKLTKKITEQYFRSDIPCGFPCCKNAHTFNDLSESTHFEFYLLPTARIIKKYKSLFKSNHFNTIFLHSSLKHNEKVHNGFIFYDSFFEKTAFCDEIEIINEFFDSKTAQKIAERLGLNEKDFKIPLNVYCNERSNDLRDETAAVKKKSKYIEKCDISSYKEEHIGSVERVFNLKEDDTTFTVKSYVSNIKFFEDKINSMREDERISFLNQNLYDIFNLNIRNFDLKDKTIVHFLSALSFYKKHLKVPIIPITESNIVFLPYLYKIKLDLNLDEKDGYFEYFSQSFIDISIENGTCFQGTLHIQRYGRGTVMIEYKGKRISVKIENTENLNRAIHLDKVYVEVWSKDNNKVINDCFRKINIKKNKHNNRDCVKSTSKTKRKKESKLKSKHKISSWKYADKLFKILGTESDKDFVDIELVGRIVGIKLRKPIPVIATIEEQRSGPSYVIATPFDRKMPKIRLFTSQPNEIIGCRILVNIYDWDLKSKYPIGSYIKKVGVLGDYESEIQSILLSQNINYDNYKENEGMYEIYNYFNKNKNELNKKDNHNNIDLNFNDSDIQQTNLMGINNIEREKITETEFNEFYKELVNSETSKRIDFRDTNVFSIDPVGCTDIDDALSITIGEIIEIGVHIADVSFFVFPDSNLDIESSNRGTSVYLTDRRLDMLPRYLSSGICSLVENEDRLVFSVIFEFDFNFELLSYKITKGIIKSKRSFTYEEAHNAMKQGKYTKELGYIHQIADKLKKKRIENGALELSSNEIKFHFSKSKYNDEVKHSVKINGDSCKTYDNYRKENPSPDLETKIKSCKFYDDEDKSTSLAINANIDLYKLYNDGNSPEQAAASPEKCEKVFLSQEKEAKQGEILNEKNLDCLKGFPKIQKIEQKKLFETNSMVEEFMLLANVTVAKTIKQYLPDSSLLRKHPVFSDDAFLSLKKYLATQNYDFDHSSSKKLNESIHNIKEPRFQELIKRMVIRSMNQATYFPSGSIPEQEFRHYGLAEDIYTHFTSPIRRYADIIVHRQLEYILHVHGNLYNRGYIYHSKFKSSIQDQEIQRQDHQSLANNYKYSSNVDFLDKRIVENICDKINLRNKCAMYAGLESTKLFIYMYIREQNHIEVDAYISRLNSTGINVFAPSLQIEDFVKVTSYQYNEKENTYLNKEKVIFCLYQPLKIKLLKNDERFFVKRHFHIEIVRINK